MQALFSSNYGVSEIYAACCFNELIRESILGHDTKILLCGWLLLSKSCVLLVILRFQPKSMTMVAVRVREVWQRHSPNGSIHCLLVKPGMCFNGQCAPHYPHRITSPIPTTVAKDYGMVVIILNRVIILFLFLTHLFVYYGRLTRFDRFCFCRHCWLQVSV